MNEVDDFSFLGVAGASPDANYPPTNIRLDLLPNGARAATPAEVLEARKRARYRAAEEEIGVQFQAKWSEREERNANMDMPTGSKARAQTDLAALELTYGRFVQTVEAIQVGSDHTAAVAAVNAVPLTWPTIAGPGA